MVALLCKVDDVGHPLCSSKPEVGGDEKTRVIGLLSWSVYHAHVVSLTSS